MNLVEKANDGSDFLLGDLFCLRAFAFHQIQHLTPYGHAAITVCGYGRPAVDILGDGLRWKRSAVPLAQESEIGDLNLHDAGDLAIAFTADAVAGCAIVEIERRAGILRFGLGSAAGRDQRQQRKKWDDPHTGSVWIGKVAGNPCLPKLGFGELVASPVIEPPRLTSVPDFAPESGRFNVNVCTFLEICACLLLAESSSCNALVDTLE